MDFPESMKIVFMRIQKLEPKNAKKIIGYLLLHDDSDQQMNHLARSPDVYIQEVIHKSKANLQHLHQLHQQALKSASVPVSELPQHLPPFSPLSSRSFVSPATFQATPMYADPHFPGANNNLGYAPFSYNTPDLQQNQSQVMSLEDQMEPVNMGNSGFTYYPDSAFHNFGGRTNRCHQNMDELPVKTCHYFKKGYCKHGSNCRYYHGQASDSFPQMIGNSSADANNEEQLLSPGSLQKLEFEIAELLRERQGQPVSIASLPSFYFERYKKVLQADGYLTESQRHGRAGYSLTKLLARFNNRILLIDRPHGQHAVILVEDASRFLENRNRRNDPGPIVSGSRQLYLTFPAESTFTEDDVSNYFNNFGPVEDVRIPCLAERMYGFVTFASSDTVKTILSKGNPHFVCGSRVLGKPYREKPKLVERKQQDVKTISNTSNTFPNPISPIHPIQDSIEIPMYYSHYVDMDNELHSIPSGSEASRSLTTPHFMENHEQSFELERRRFEEELHLTRAPVTNFSYVGYPVDTSTISNDHLDFPSEDCLNNVMDILNSDDMNHISTTYNDQDSSDAHIFPDSPFAASIISALI